MWGVECSTAHDVPKQQSSCDFHAIDAAIRVINIDEASASFHRREWWSVTTHVISHHPFLHSSFY